MTIDVVRLGADMIRQSYTQISSSNRERHLDWVWIWHECRDVGDWFLISFHDL